MFPSVSLSYPHLSLPPPPQIDGFDKFQKRALELSLLLKDFYLTFVDVLAWREAALALLEELARHMVDMHFDATHEVCVRFLDLFAAFAQVHVLAQRVPARKLLIVVYARAVHCTEGNSETNFARYVCGGTGAGAGARVWR